MGTERRRRVERMNVDNGVLSKYSEYRSMHHFLPENHTPQNLIKISFIDLNTSFSFDTNVIDEVYNCIKNIKLGFCPHITNI